MGNADKQQKFITKNMMKNITINVIVKFSKNRQRCIS